jgi:hypothetical protein
MSTKNLSRTVIEGGRDGYSRFTRRHSHVVERRAVHMVEQRLCHSLEPETAEFPALERAWKSFADKLNPARRWLRSQVGRPWDKVRSELFTRFDTRTTAGRHIVFDHLLREVDTYPPDRYRVRDFWISPHGILRYQQFDRKRQAAARRKPQLPEADSVLRHWLGGRRVIEHGARLYWLLPTPHGGYRQHQELNEIDGARFCALPRWFRKQFTGAPPSDGGSS